MTTRLDATSGPLVGAVVTALALGTFLLIQNAGGSPSPLNHLGYVPILVAAYRFGWRGGLGAGLFVTVLLGPATLVITSSGTVETPTAWLIRGMFFITIGTVTGLLFERVRLTAGTAADRERELRAIIDTTEDALLVANDDRQYVAANPAACRMFGLPLHELLERRVDDFIPDADPLGIEESWTAFLHAGAQRGEMRLRRPDGREIEVDFAAVARHLPGRHLSILRDITERKATEAQLQRHALFDALTELPNPTLLLDRLRLAVRQARQAGVDVALIHVGIDGFKGLNDALGRAAGDQVLRTVADRLLAATREGDTVARTGGDEFAVIIGDPVDAETAWQATERILVVIGEPIDVLDMGGAPVTLTASAGLAIFPADAADEDGLLRSAGLAYRTAKRRGVALAAYTSEQDEGARSRWTRMMELRDAVRGDELVLHYQPVFRATDLELISAEALVRWNHPTDGLLGPEEFVPLAEGSGLIDDLARTVVGLAVRQAVAWASEGRAVPTAVNLSPLNLRSPETLEFIMAAVREADLDPALLKLEITESAIMHADAPTMAALGRVHAMGVRIAIDDFGTGYSSLGSLRSLPIDEVKLDRTFIGRMRDSDADRRIVRTVIELAHGLGLEVTAEEVEDEATLAMLRDMGCDAIQGYLTGRPIPAEEVHLRRPVLAEAAAPLSSLPRSGSRNGRTPQRARRSDGPA
jgi:diguanylate cyclase (GGDEF)-like protein/PAS domain S-box-containing protein